MSNNPFRIPIKSRLHAAGPFRLGTLEFLGYTSEMVCLFNAQIAASHKVDLQKAINDVFAHDSGLVTIRYFVGREHIMVGSRHAVAAVLVQSVIFEVSKLPTSDPSLFAYMKQRSDWLAEMIDDSRYPQTFV